MPTNEIYKFLKDNNLTQKDEASFLKEYSDSAKAKELYGFMQGNGLTSKDFNSFYDTYLKKKDGGIPVTTISEDVLKTGFVPQSSVPSSGTLSPLEIPRPQGQGEKVRVEAAPKPKETKYGGSGVLDIGEPYMGKPSARVQKLIESGGAFKPETKEKDLIRRSIEKGSLQGELANALPIDSKPNTEQLKKIANINKKIASLPQSDAEKAFQKDGFGVFKKDPLLGAEYLLETIISSGASLFESAKRTAGAGVVTGAAMGAPIAGIGALAGAATGLTAGISAGGVNLSTSSKIMELLNESGVDISDEDSLIAAFSDEKKMAQLRKKAADYALPIFYFDLAAAGLAGRFANKAVGKSVGKKVLAATKEVGLQSASGSAGELTGQLASGQKVNWSDVAMEGIASIATDAPELVRPIGSLVVGRKNASSNNKTIVKQVVNLGEEVGKQDAVENLKRDLNNGVISEEEYKQGLEVVEKAAEVAKNVPPDLSPKEKVEIIQSVVEDREPDFGMGDVTDDEYNVFIDKGIVTEERLNDIAKKVKEQDQLDEREKAIFTSYTGQINDIIAQEEAQPSYTQEEISKPIELSPELPEGYTLPQPIQPEEQITTEEQFKEPLVETVEDKTGLILYHGTPHSFEKFDISKLGTGEGQQAFGHGLYFTNKKSIAEGYANNLSSKKKFWEALMDGNEISLTKEDFDFINSELDSLGFDGSRAEMENLGNVKVDGKDEYSPSVLEALAVLFGKNAKSVLKEDYGLSDSEVERMIQIKKKISDPQLYTISLHKGKSASEYDYLDWHGALSDKQKKKIGDVSGNSGEEVYKNLSKKLGGDKAASDYLLSKGIDGIVYKSERGTGGADGKGRNYVVFDEKSIVIEDINGEKISTNLEESQVIPLQEQQKSQDITLQKQSKETINDKENITGVSGEIGEGKEPIQAQPIKETSGEKINPSGDVQSNAKEEVAAKSIKDKFKDIANINLSDNPEVVKKREVTKYLKDNPEIADVVKNFRKVTDYLEAQGELKKSSPDC